MATTRLHVGIMSLVGVSLLGYASEARAQFNFGIYPNYRNIVNARAEAQFLTLLQQQAAVRAIAQGQFLFPAGNPALMPVSPYAPLGVNPYAPLGVNPYGGGVANPYTPYTSATGATPYDQSYSNPYTAYADPTGGVLRGQADVMRAYGTVITSQEQARLMRETALQAKLDTQKKRFDLNTYIEANTPTYTEKQAKIAKMTLKRIQTNSSESEIVNGKALNLLLDDMRKYPGKRAGVEPFALSEEVLGHLNVTKGNYSLGILRNSGEFTWPAAFLQEYFPSDQLKLVETQAKTLVKNAEKGNKLDGNVLKDMRSEIDKIREQLFKRVNEIPTSEYLEAKRFLNDFDDARQALERGEAMTQVTFQKWAADGKKNLQQLVDYMIANGLKFTSATMGDEFAYRAAYSGMVAMDVALNTQGGTPADQLPEPKDN